MSDPNQAKSIFLSASELPTAEREAYLDSATAGDPALRMRVEALLRAHDTPDSFLEQPAAQFGATVDLSPVESPIAEQLGSWIGPYKLLEQIGEGGMGVVYLAEQQAPVRRRVALKVVKTGMDTRQVIARFEAERQALALMDHSNIARVLDAGATDSGRPYFVMELVRGVPITEYCDQNNLPVRERLELFTQVCYAVQHAHQKGIIHRDIKPSNVMVTINDGRAVPKVIDFGIAKATGQQLTEKTLFTAFSQMVGTPLYMSPEQAEMTSVDIDTRSDIYSLGVLLYELLTGTTPFDQQRLRAAAFDEVRRIIREEEPPRPSTRISTLGETRTATAAHRKADPNRLRRLVEGDLDWIVMKSLDKDRARRYDTAGDFAADVLRHLSQQPVEACPPSAMYRVRKYVRRNTVALTTAAIVATSLILATVVGFWQATLARRAESLAEARLVAETQARAKATSVTKLLHELLKKVLLAEKEKTRRQSLLQPVVDTYREVIQVQPRDAVAYINLGEALGSQEKLDEAVAAIHKAIDLEPNNALAHNNLGYMLTRQGKADEAMAAYLKAIELDPRDPLPHVNLGNALYFQRQLDEAIVEYRKAIALKGETAELADAYTDLGNALNDQGKFEESIAAHREAIRLKPYHAGAYLNLGNTFQHQEKLDEAVAAFRRATELQPDYAEAFENLGIALNEQRQFDESITAFRTAIKLRPDKVDPYYSLGRILQARDKFDDSIAMYLKVIELKPDYAEAYANLGISLSLQGKLDEAIAAYRKAIELKPDLLNAYATLAIALNTQRKSDEATAVLRKAIESKPDLVTLSELCMALTAPGKLDDTIAVFRRGLELKPSADNYNAVAWALATSPLSEQRHRKIASEWAARAVELSPQEGNLWNTLGVAHYRAGEWQPAIEALEKSIKLIAEEDASNWIFLAMSHWQLGDKVEARRWYDKAVAWMEMNKPTGDELRLFRAEAEGLLVEKPAESATKGKPD